MTKNLQARQSRSITTRTHDVSGVRRPVMAVYHAHAAVTMPKAPPAVMTWAPLALPLALTK